MDAEVERRVDEAVDRHLKGLGLNGNIVHRRMEAMLRNRIDFKIERKVAEEVPRVLAQRVDAAMYRVVECVVAGLNSLGTFNDLVREICAFVADARAIATMVATPPRQVFLSVPGPYVDCVSWRIPGPYPLFLEYGEFITVFRDPDGKPVGVLIRKVKYITKAARDVLRLDIKAGTPLGTLFAFACLSLDADEKVRALAGIPELLAGVLLPEADWGRGTRDAAAL